MQKQAEKYWPNVGASEAHGQVTVRTINEAVPFMKFEEREIQVESGNQQKKVHKLRHIHWHGWQDFGIPSNQSFLTVKRMCDDMLECIQKNEPVVVHCSAGIGRTGTLLAIVDLLSILQSGQTSDISVFNIVHNLREHRYGSVQTLEQYQFIYDFAKQCIQKGLYVKPQVQ